MDGGDVNFDFGVYLFASVQVAFSSSAAQRSMSQQGVLDASLPRTIATRGSPGYESRRFIGQHLFEKPRPLGSSRGLTFRGGGWS